MKDRIYIGTVVSCLMLMSTTVLWTTQCLAEQQDTLTAEEIIKKVDQVAISDSSKGIMSQTITTTGGAKRTMEMLSYSKNGTDKQLTKYTKPARVKGESMLMLNDGNDIWYYSPRTDRVRKIASNAKKKKVLGSDFSYEDMAAGTMAEKYTSKLLGEKKEQGEKCYLMEMIPTPTGPSYSKIHAWVDKKTFVTLRVDYWDKGEKPFKRLIIGDVKKIDNHMTPMKYTMTNLKEGSETVMEVIKVEYDIELKDSMFTERNLKKR